MVASILDNHHRVSATWEYEGSTFASELRVFCEEEGARALKKGKRQALNDLNTRNLLRSLNEYFSMKVEIPRIRCGKSQEIETLINEEAFLFAKYLRDEKSTWIPRVAELSARGVRVSACSPFFVDILIDS
jgi:hypothetical protein